ncbi:hypothetical protein R3P38DRAFT_3233885 [Favolaschia claudopus]|uniref:Uncharacterized protein n=1 Tax=Favolaschia claudopus TaxID=2862362 RepID=A0AAV9ZHJ7_9AGAR
MEKQNHTSENGPNLQLVVSQAAPRLPPRVFLGTEFEQYFGRMRQIESEQKLKKVYRVLTLAPVGDIVRMVDVAQQRRYRPFEPYMAQSSSPRRLKRH